jgi:1,2-phenylacetyl-CoA epoxidase catalytic subunit
MLDYLNTGWPPKLIQDWFNLTTSQMADVLAYLASNREDVEQEYQQVVQHAEELRRYWDKRVQEHLANRAAHSPTPERAKLQAKLQAWKTQLAQQ